LELNDFTAAVPDLERVVKQDRKYDFQRAPGIAGPRIRQHRPARKKRKSSFARFWLRPHCRKLRELLAFLAAQGRIAEAREIAQRVLAKKPAMPAYQKRRERPWFRKAAQILKRLPA